MIYALRVNDDWSCKVLKDMKEDGVGRFGWSYISTANLYDLRKKIKDEGWDKLSVAEKDCYQGFLLELKENDYVVYINVPKFGKCTLARVTDPYFWHYEGEGSDFNHRFHVDPESVFVFDRNDAIVHPSLSRRLKLRGRFWRIYLQEEFEELVENLKKGKDGQPRTPETQFDLLKKEIQPFLAEITQKIQFIFPNTDLEELIARVFKNIPGIKVIKQGGPGDYGADLILHFESGPPVPELQTAHRCVVQVKSYEGEQGDTKAVSDIRRALEYWQADMGMIISTASSGSEVLDNALNELREETGKPVSLLIGEEVAAFVLRFGGYDLL